MTWHRDTYMSNGKIIGPFKPCFKLMVYPDLYNLKSKEISLIKSSHNRLDFNSYHKYFSSLNFKKDIFSDNTNCIFIDTTILHKAISSLKIYLDQELYIIFLLQRLLINFIKLN